MHVLRQTPHTIALHIAANHPALPGHFPGMPLLPGVVLLDHALHAIAARLPYSLDACRLHNIKFLRPVTPIPDTGIQLELQYEMNDKGSIHFSIIHDGYKTVSGSIHA